MDYAAADRERDYHEAIYGRAGRHVPHWEHWSCPDAETVLTGIDHYDRPRDCRLRWNELFPHVPLNVPATNAPLSRPTLAGGADREDCVVRWGDAATASFRHGEAFFKTPEEVFAFSPLAKGDFTDWPHVVMNWDFRDEEALYRRLRAGFPADWGDRPPPEAGAVCTGFYNTMFMWPVLAFGWALFLECCLDDEFDRIMEEFAELNRRVFRVLARLPVVHAVCHDDIATTRGPVCSPAWMRKHIYPRYEEYFGMLRDAGRRVIFIADGCMDQLADEVFACGAQGLVGEPCTDYRAIAGRHRDVCLAGEGDNRVLSRNRPEEIDAMVRGMLATARECPGYMMCVGNHIPWNLPPEAVGRYLGRCAEWGWR